MQASNTPTTPAQPLSAPTCPLCGQPNVCQVACSGSFDTPCWCSNVSFAPGVLDKVPPASQRLACLCRTCAQGQTT